jgi:four helix bundle protein
MASYKELIVWQKAFNVAVDIYTVTKKFPKDEIFGMTSQMRRSAVSISSNIAEGSLRGTKKDYVHFLRISLGSCAELENQILLSEKIGLIKKEDCTTITGQLAEVMKILNVIIKKLSN